MDLLGFLTIIFLAVGIALTAFQFYKARIAQKKRKAYVHAMQKSMDNGYTTVECYIDKLGNKWRTFENPLKLAGFRTLAAEVAAEKASMNVNSKELLRYVKKIKEHLNKGHITEGYGLFDRLEERIQGVNHESLILDLAKCYFLLEDEPADRRSETYDRRKEEIWKQDEQCRDFFLCKAFRIMYDVSNTSDKQILSYLRTGKNPITA